MTDIWERLKNTRLPIVLYGMGNGADLVIEKLSALGLAPVGVFASPGFARGNTYKGFQITTYEEQKAKYEKMIILMCFGSQRPEVLSYVKKLASEQEFYAPSIPVIGDGLFDKKYAADNFKDLYSIYKKLEDDKSRQVFKNIVKFHISGKPEYLFRCETNPSEALDILSLSENEIFMDLGAYNGDTVTDFVNKAKSYKCIYAVEPDNKTFEKLKRKTEFLENIVYINKLISSEKCYLPFSSKGGRNSGVSEKGSLKESDSVDNILSGKPVSYIKFDVEGQEVEAIKGAKNSILKYKPKLLISCYHRKDDLISIPKQVFSIRNDYKIYIRHYPYVPAWDTQYYFI